ncbi:hypothetical protein BDU57DRAFT_563962 [Ampelomyces quisqualis]|uniref:DUF7918 domain-containing protein n=1 Tax=Ampelomyces quisqualis TaxID=50730 RepID=A0A6A5R7H0_AMPQU|nr:hypothetical protein BDU57DRAFT_563962 [Ampelomyces quisqualis]
MAILEGVPGLKVQIVVQGQALREYEDDTAQVAENTVERYVEAQDGEQFEISYDFGESFPRNRAVSLIITIDGKDVDLPIIRQFELHEPGGHVSSGPVYRDGSSWRVRKYEFAAMTIEEHDDEETPEDLKAKLERVGVITCGFYFLENSRRSRCFLDARKEMEVLPPVSEKVVKGDALSHQTTLGATEPTDKLEYYDADYADGGEPFATFHFYYRSLAALKDLHIVEHSPDPLDLLYSDDDAVAQLNREQLEAIVRRFRDEADARAHMKRESSSETIGGNEDDTGDRRNSSDPDLVELRCVDLRATRKVKRVRQLPTPESEVIVIDD